MFFGHDSPLNPMMVTWKPASDPDHSLRSHSMSMEADGQPNSGSGPGRPLGGSGATGERHVLRRKPRRPSARVWTPRLSPGPHGGVELIEVDRRVGFVVATTSERGVIADARHDEGNGIDGAN
jgi:hypothetical protein